MATNVAIPAGFRVVGSAPAQPQVPQRTTFQRAVESNPVTAGLVGLGGGLIKGATGVLQAGAQLVGADEIAQAAGLVTQDINRDLERLGTAGQVGGFVGEVAPYVALPASAPTLAGRVALGAAAGGAQGALQAQERPDMAQRGQGALTGAAIGAAAPVALAGVGKALQKAAPRIDQEVAKLATRAQEFGIPLTMTQVAPSRVKNTLQKATQALPFSGTQNFTDTQIGAWNKAVAKTIGVDAERLTPEAVNEFLDKASTGFNSVLKGKTITTTTDDLAAIRGVVTEAKDTVGGDALRVIEANAKKAIQELGEGAVDGQKLANFRSGLIKRLPRMEAGAKQYVAEIVDKIDEVAERSIGPDAVRELQGLRRQWRNFKTLEPLLEKSADQAISPASLMQRVASSPFIKASRAETGSDDLVDLAKIGKLMPQLGGSDTLDKAALLGGSATSAGAVAGLLDPTYLAITGGTLGASRAYQSLYNQSQRLVNAAVKRSLPNSKPTMLQRVADALVGGTPDDVVRAAGSKQQAIKTVQAIARDADDATKAEAAGLVDEIRRMDVQNANPSTPSGGSVAPAARNSQRGNLYGTNAPLALGGAGLAAGVAGMAMQERQQKPEKTPKIPKGFRPVNNNNQPPNLPPIFANPDAVSKTFLINEEGFRSTSYKDSLGITTIGYGFNLEQPNAAEIIKRVKIPERYELLRNGTQALSEDSARKLFDYKHRKSEQAAAKIVPQFNSLGENQRAALTSMAYHMGGEGLRKFRRTLAYLADGNAKAVENQLLSSEMARQTPARAQRTALMLAYNLSPKEAEARLVEQGRIDAGERKYMTSTAQVAEPRRQRVRYNEAKAMVGLANV
jgi:lysozyme